MSKETLQKQNHNMGSVSFMEKFLFFDQVFVINTHVQKKKKNQILSRQNSSNSNVHSTTSSFNNI